MRVYKAKYYPVRMSTSNSKRSNNYLRINSHIVNVILIIMALGILILLKNSLISESKLITMKHNLVSSLLK